MALDEDENAIRRGEQYFLHQSTNSHVRTMKVMMAAMMVMLGAREDMIDPRNAAFWSSLSNKNFP